MMILYFISILAETESKTLKEHEDREGLREVFILTN